MAVEKWEIDTVHSGVGFTVNDIANSTVAGAVPVTVVNIVLASAAKQLRLSLQADAATFSPPGGGAATWNASDVTWAAAAWS